MTEQPDYDEWARETPDTPASRLAAQLDAAAAAGEGLCILLAAEIADARALLRERDELAVKLETWYREAQSLRAQRDSMETALNKANAELHFITRCGTTFETFSGAGPSRPCMREKGHPGGHRNIDGTEWREHARAASAENIAGLAAPPRHHSPGRGGPHDLPDHMGPEETCYLPDCVLRRAQHQAAADIQTLTAELFTNQDPT